MIIWFEVVGLRVWFGFGDLVLVFVVVCWAFCFWVLQCAFWCFGGVLPWCGCLVFSVWVGWFCVLVGCVVFGASSLRLLVWWCSVATT